MSVNVLHGGCGFALNISTITYAHRPPIYITVYSFSMSSSPNARICHSMHRFQPTISELRATVGGLIRPPPELKQIMSASGRHLGSEPRRGSGG